MGLTSVVHGNTTVGWLYDAKGRIVTRQQLIIAGPTLSARYAYSANGQLLAQAYPSGKSVYWTYDAGGRPHTRAAAPSKDSEANAENSCSSTSIFLSRRALR